MVTVSDRSIAYVRDRVREHMKANISIYRHPDTVTFDDMTGMVSIPARSVQYTGIARIWSVNTGTPAIIGDVEVSTSSTNISVPIDDFLPEKDDVVVVNSNPGDTSITGKAFRVINVDGGGLIGGARRMQCVALADSAEWEEQ